MTINGHRNSGNDASGIVHIGTGFGGQAVAPKSCQAITAAIAQKNGSLPEDKLPLRLCWGYYPLAIPAAACSASGFRSKSVNGRWFSPRPLALLRSVTNPQLVQLPDDLSPSDPFGLAPLLFGLSPIIDPEINFLFLRKTN